MNLIRTAALIAAAVACSAAALGQLGGPAENSSGTLVITGTSSGTVEALAAAAATAPASAPATAPAVAAVTAVTPSAVAPTYFPGGIVDDAWKTAYLTGSDGQLNAIDIATGKKLWASASTARVLTLDGDRVYALMPSSSADADHPSLHIAALSIKGQGKIIFQSKPITVPEWICNGAPETKFVTIATLEKGHLNLTWAASGIDMVEDPNGRWVGGGRRMIRIRPAVPTPVNASGAATVNLADGALKTGTAGALAMDPVKELQHDGKTYRLELDAETNTAKVTCTDPAKRKTLWAAEVQPPTAAPSSGSTPAGAPAQQPVPFQWQPDWQGGIQIDGMQQGGNVIFLQN